MRLVPPFPYFGGKMRIAEQIIAQFPEHDRYCEPFAGSLAVLLAKPPESVEIVNDLDSRLVNFWRTLRERGDELWEACSYTPHSREEYDRAKKGPAPEDPIENARQLWILYTQSVSAAYEQAGWRPPGSTRKSTGAHLSRFSERFAGIAQRLHHVSLENLPAEKIIRRHMDDEGMLFYVDPPYLAETRVNEKDYVHDMSSEAEHRALLELLVQVRGPVVLSGYPSDLYDSILTGWTVLQIGAQTQNGGERTEVLYINRTPPTVLFGSGLWEE